VSRQCGAASDTECSVCSAPCGAGTYEAVPCGLNGQDRLCLPCRGTCPSGEYAFRACSASRDAVCAPCSHCSAGQYVSAQCTATSDTACQTISSCRTNQYQVSAATASSDTVCAPCISNCGAGSFISTACSAFNNSACAPCGQCPNGQFPTRACDGVANVACQNCTQQCASGHFRVAECSRTGGDLQCAQCTQCAAENYAIVPCGTSNDAACARCNERCIAGFYEASPCSGASNRVCAACSTCGAGQFRVSSCTTSSNTVCRNCTSCPAGTREVTPCTATSDRVCEPCETCTQGVAYQVAICSATTPTLCANCTQCASGQFETVACTPVTNRGCRACATCGFESTMATPCGVTTDTSCTACACCGANEYETAQCTPTTPTQCAACATCVAGVSYARTPCGSTCLSCSPPCAAGLVEITPCANGQDRVCVNATLQFDQCFNSSHTALEIPLPEQALFGASASSECAARCLATQNCTGFSHSVSRQACLLLASYDLAPPGTAAPRSSDFVYCRRAPRSVDLFALNGFPTRGFLGTGVSGVELTRFPVVGRSFAVAASFRLQPGGSGYIFSASNRDGNLRYFALYSRADGQSVDFYYAGVDGTSRFERFPAAVADGRQHNISLLVRYGQPAIVQFVLDGVPTLRLLPVSDMATCNGDTRGRPLGGCVFTVGMRSNGVGSAGRYFFTGHISQLRIFPSSALPASVDQSLAADATALASTTASLQHVFPSALTLNGSSSSALSFTSPSGARFPVYGNVTIYATARQTVGTNGYLFAKSNPAGTLRYLSLYASNRGSDALWLYYVTTGVMRRITFTQSIHDGQLHALELSLSNNVRRSLDPCACAHFLSSISKLLPSSSNHLFWCDLRAAHARINRHRCASLQCTVVFVDRRSLFATLIERLTT
jgi:hypothetical protein